MSETVTRPKIRKLCASIEASGKSPEFRAFNDLLVRVPIRDALLRCIFFNHARYAKDELIIWSVVLPLYLEYPGFALNYQGVISGPANFWRLSEEDAFVAAISEQSPSTLDKAASAVLFSKYARKICIHPDQSYVDEDIAISFAQAGNLVQAQIQLEWLNTKYWAQRNAMGRERINKVRVALKSGAVETRRVLEEQVIKSIALCELQGIEKFFEQ